MEYVYLAVALIWGLAHGQILPPRDFKEALPENVWALQAAFPIGSIGDPAPYPDYSPSKVADLLGERISSHTVHRVSAIPSQNPLAYVPQALGVEIAMRMTPPASASLLCFPWAWSDSWNQSSRSGQPMSPLAPYPQLRLAGTAAHRC